MTLSLKDREWKEFIFPEIFDIKKGFYNKKPITRKKGSIPFLGATANNNGITEFYTLEEIDKGSRLGSGSNELLENKVFKGNCIAVTNNGSVGHAYYQIHDFTCSHDINPLYLKKRTLNRYIAFFLLSTIEGQKVCFEYARKWRPMRMVKSKVLLPTTPEGEPDYDFMEQYMREQEGAKQAKYKAYITQRIEKLKSRNEIEPLNSKEWKEFFIEDIFDVRIGRNIDGNKINKNGGKTPYVTRKECYNGIDGFISYNKAFLNLDYPVITIGNETAEPFVQNSVFFTGTKVNILKPKRKIPQYSLKFIMTSLKSHKSKYSYSFTINSTRLRRQKIMLPINNNSEPDYQYMEQYMKALEYKKLKAYLDWKF